MCRAAAMQVYLCLKKKLAGSETLTRVTGYLSVENNDEQTSVRKERNIPKPSLAPARWCNFVARFEPAALRTVPLGRNFWLNGLRATTHVRCC